MKARIRVELPPGVEATPDVRAKLVKAVHAKLGCGPDCDHSDLEKSEAPPRRLPHKAPQAAVERSAAVYEQVVPLIVDLVSAEDQLSARDRAAVERYLTRVLQVLAEHAQESPARTP